MTSNPLRRRRLLGLSALFLALTLVALVAFALGRGMSSPTERAAQQAPPALEPITVPVEKATLAEVKTFVVERVDDGEGVTWGGTEGVGVITSVGVKAGETIDVGDVLASVAGRPVIYLPGQFPAYRDLTVGDQGPDVRQLQEGLQRIGLGLGGDSLGSFGPGTAAAVIRCYSVRGYSATPVAVREGGGEADSGETPPATARPVVKVGDIAYLPSGGSVGKVEVRVGDVLEPGGRLLTLASAQLRYRTAAGQEGTDLPVSGVSVGKRVTLLGAGEKLTGRVQRVAKDGVTVTLPRAPKSPPNVLSATVTTAQGPKGSLVVPLTAIRTRNDVTVVTVQEDDAQRDVEVTVDFSANGRAAVSGQLTAGDAVVVGDRPSPADTVTERSATPPSGG